MLKTNHRDNYYTKEKALTGLIFQVIQQRCSEKRRQTASKLNAPYVFSDKT